MTTAYTYHVGEKFNADGSPRPYPGSTIICFADPTSRIYQAGERLQAALLALPFAHKFGLLPPSSFHMTVFSLICDQRRTQAEWTAHLPLDAPLDAVDQYFIRALAPVVPPSSFRMVMTYLGGWGLSFRLSPADEATAVALQTYRNQASAASGVRYPDHDTYQFHLTLAYQLMALDEAEQAAYAEFRLHWGEALRGEIGVFETPAPVLTFFENMFAFVPASERLTLPSRR
jgi:hypothetical protein